MNRLYRDFRRSSAVRVEAPCAVANWFMVRIVNTAQVLPGLPPADTCARIDVT